MAQIKLNKSNGSSCQVFNKMPLNMSFLAITFFFFCLNQCMYNLLGMLPNFALVFHGHLLFFCFVDFFSKISFMNIIRVYLFGSRSGPTFCRASDLIMIQTVCKGYQQPVTNSQTNKIVKHKFHL